VASLAPRSNERAAAKGFHGLVGGFLATRVGTRTCASLAGLGPHAAPQAAGGGDPDGLAPFVRLADLAAATHARFEQRLRDQRAARQQAEDDARAAAQQAAALATAAQRRLEKAASGKGSFSESKLSRSGSRSGRRH
jgi:multidrug efflux pump subunit AcrA (membrane-fusion protein)